MLLGDAVFIGAAAAVAFLLHRLYRAHGGGRTRPDGGTMSIHADAQGPVEFPRFGYNVFADPKLAALDPEWYPTFRSFLEDLVRRTDAYNNRQGTAWNWRITNTRRSGPANASRHNVGRAVDLNLWSANTGQTIKTGLSGPKPEHWHILELLRQTALDHNLRWGGLFRNADGSRYWDPVHIDDKPYVPRDEPWWFSQAPGAR